MPGTYAASVQLAMVGLVVADMKRSLDFYRALGLEIPDGENAKRFVMHRMASGVTLFFDTVFFPANDPQRRPAEQGRYNVSLEFYAGTREAVDAIYEQLTGLGHAGRKAPWQSSELTRPDSTIPTMPLVVNYLTSL